MHTAQNAVHTCNTFHYNALFHYTLHNAHKYKCTHAGGGRTFTLIYCIKITITKHTAHMLGEASITQCITIAKLQNTQHTKLIHNTQYTIYSTHAGGGEYHTLHTGITSITHCTIHTNSEHKCTKIHTAHCTQIQMQCTFTLFHLIH